MSTDVASMGLPETPADLPTAAAAYAASVDIDVTTEDLSWEVSTQAKRSAGACIYEHESEAITIRLTWGAYQVFGWEEFTDVIRHELVHAWEFQHFGEASHGRRFDRMARAVDAPRHCRRFSEARLHLVCTDGDCDWCLDRHRASKAVTDPANHRCGACRSPYVVEHVATGERWETTDGYRQARDRIGDAW